MDAQYADLMAEIGSAARAAAAMGVDVRRTRILAYTLTSTLAGLAGMVYAFVDNTVNPTIFGLENVFLLLFMIIIGGIGRAAGAVVGAVLMFSMAGEGNLRKGSGH